MIAEAIWPILAEVSDRRTATYCKRHDLPALNVIVVKKQDGRPGVAVKLSKAGTASDEIDLVHALDWANIHAPSARELSLSETATS